MRSSWVVIRSAPQHTVPPPAEPETAQAAGLRHSVSSSPAITPSIVWAFNGEKPSTMPAADFCRTINLDCSRFSGSFHTRQTSRGKTLGFRCVDAEFIKRSPIADGRLCGHVPTRLNYVTPHIQFLFVAPQFCVELPSDPASRQRPCLQLTVPTTTACSGLAPHKFMPMLGVHKRLQGDAAPPRA